MLLKLETKGFRGLTRTIGFSRSTLIGAGNGLGKTTILDAIRWCLTGVDGEDKSNNNVFDNRKVDCAKETVEVRCTFVDSDGVETVFGRTAVRKGENVKYSYTYGEIDVPAKKYAAFVEKALMPIPQLKFVLNVRRWDLLDESVLREALLGLYDGAGIICDAAYKDIREEIEVSGLKETKKRMRKEIKTLDGALDTIQVELNMAEQNIPEAIETGDIQARLDERESELKLLEDSTSEVPEELRERLQNEAKAIADLEDEYSEASRKHHIGYTMRLQELQGAYEQAKNDRRSMDRLTAEKECEQAVIENGKQRMKELEAEYDDVLKRVFEGACPCCGRPYEGAQRDELMAEHKKFKDEAIAKIRSQAKRVKDNVEAARGRIAACESKIAEIKSCDTDALLAEIKKMEADGEKPFADTEQGIELLNKIEAAKANRTDVSDYDKERVNRMASIRNEIFDLKMRFSDSERILKDREDGLKKAEEIKARRAQVVKSHTDAESLLALANRYEIALLQGLQDYINDMLNAGAEGDTHISLYYVDPDGEVHSQCKIISGGVASTINNAQRNIIGLRLAEALIRKTGNDVPVLIDNAEAFDRSHMPSSVCQLIVAKVDECGGELKVCELPLSEEQDK